MKLKKLNLILLSTIALSACNGGNGGADLSSSNQKDPTELVPNPRIAQAPRTTRSLQAGNFGADLANILLINKGVKIGDGYDPTTGLRLITPDFKIEKFNYMSGREPISGIADVNGRTTLECSKGVYGDELGQVSSYSSANLYKADLSGATGIGIGKVAVALSYAYQNTFASDGMHYDKVFGGKQVCPLDSIVAPSANPQSNTYANAAEAIRNASVEINDDIAEIENAPDAYTRKVLIAKFYKNHGTYMISSVQLGAVAIKNIHMSENKTSSSSDTHIAAAASYSSPFSEASASYDQQNATKFSSADWNFSIASAQYPTGSVSDGIMTAIVSLEDQINQMKTDGIIDFNNNLTPDPAKIKDPTPPKLPEINKQDITDDYEAALTAVQAFNTAVGKINTDIPTSFALKSSRYKQNAGSITDAMTQITTLKNPGKTTPQLSLLLSANSLKKFNESAPLIQKWQNQGLADLYNSAVTELAKDKPDTAAITEIDNEIKALLGQAAEDSKKEEQEKKKIDEDKAQEEKNAEDKADKNSGTGITWSQFLLSKMRFISPDEYRDYHAFLSTNPTQANKIFAAFQMEHPSEMEHWRKEFKKNGGEFKVPLMVSANEAQKFNKMSLKAAQTDGPSNIYDNYGVLDYAITPWVKIFPVLSPGFSIDDAKEVGAGLIISNINTSYNQEFDYLTYVQKIDGSLNQLYTQTKAERSVLDKLNLALMNTRVDSQNSNVSFNGKTYDISTDDYIDLNQAVTNYIKNSKLVNSDWYKITKVLFDKGLIGQYGSFAGLQPVQPASQASSEYSIISQNGTVLADGSILNSPGAPEKRIVDPTFVHNFPRAASMDKADNYTYYNLSPMRIQVGALAAFMGMRGQEIPGRGIMEGDRSMLLPSNNYFKQNYMTSAYTPADRLALKYVPDNGKPTNILGIIPVVLSKSKMVNNKITGLGVIDSKGRIWGLNAGTGGDGGDNFTAKTLTYTLDLSRTVGSNSTSPAYPLTLEDDGDGLVLETRGKAPNGNTWEYTYNKYVLGVSFDNNFSKGAFNNPDQDGNKWYWNMLKGGDIKNSCTQVPLMVWDNVIYFITLEHYYPYLNGNNLAKFMVELSHGAQSVSLGHSLDRYIYIPCEQMISDIPEQSKFTATDLGKYTLKHQLVITPITNAVAQDMGEVLANTPGKQPLLPTYPF